MQARSSSSNELRTSTSDAIQTLVKYEMMKVKEDIVKGIENEGIQFVKERLKSIRYEEQTPEEDISSDEDVSSDSEDIESD